MADHPLPERRKNRTVDAPRQARIVAGITAWPMAVLLVAAVVMWVLTSRLFDEAQQSNAELPSLGALAMTEFLFVVLTGALAVWEAWRYSHRVMGPALRIAASLRKLREGQTDFTVELRRGDELQPIAAELNPLIEELRRRAGGAEAAAGAPSAGAPAAGLATSTTTDSHGD